MQAKFAIKNNGMQMQRGFVCFIRSCSRNANNLLLNFYYIEIKVQSSSFYIRCKKSYFRCSRESFLQKKSVQFLTYG